MLLAAVFRGQAGVCAHLAEDCDDRWLAERLRVMASDLMAKADDFEELPVERVKYQDRGHLLSQPGIGPSARSWQ
jgi:hypothetical protein